MHSSPVGPTLVGRDAEFAMLRERIARLISGRGGSVWIDGEPGVGKTALVDAGLSGTQARGVRIFRATARQTTQSAGLRVLADCLGVRECHTDKLRSDIAERLVRRGGGVDAVSAAGEWMLSLVEQECTRSPVAIVIDDLQWADEASLAVWHRLARTVDAVPLLLLATRSPLPFRAAVDSLRRAVTHRASAVVVELNGLDPQNVAAMAGSRLSAMAGEQLLGVLAQAGGNPRYVGEMVDVLVAEGLVRVDDGVAELARSVRPGLPSFSGAIGGGLSFLPEPTRTVLRSAAALGLRFTLEDLSLVSERPVPALVAVVQEAMAAGVLADDGADLTFRHPVVHQTLQDEVPTSMRARLHTRAAKALADAGASWDRVTRHLLATPQVVDGWAWEWLASLPASEMNASPAVAVDLLELARSAIEPADPRRDCFTARLTTVLRLLRRYDDLALLASDAFTLGREPTLVAEIACNVGLGLHALGRTAEAADVIALVLDGPDPGGAWRTRARALHAMVQFAEGCPDDALAEANRAFKDGERDGDALTIAWSLDTVLRCASDGVALAYLDQAVVGLVGEDPETTDLVLELLTTRLTYLTRLDCTTQFEADLSKVATLAERANPRWRGMLHAVAAADDYERGDWDQALHRVELAAAAGDADSVQEARTVAARIAARRGNHALAAEHMAVANTSYGIGCSRFGRGGPLPVRALLAEASGQVHVATAMLVQGLNVSERTTARDRHEWLLTLVRLALSAGDLETAQAAVDAACSDAEAGIGARVELAAQICRAMAKDDPVALLAAADHFEHVRRLPDLAFVLEEAAVRLAQHGDLPGARHAFCRAITIYADLGATIDMRRAQARLRPHGIRRSSRSVGRRATTGWEALTPAERSVADRVMAGESNPEIAADLFLSRRTVEAHVARILTKLDVRSRVDVAREAGRRDDQGDGMIRATG